MLNTKYTVCALWLAKELEKRGFKCIGTDRNKSKPEFHVFYFEDTEDLRKEVDNIVRYERNGTVSKSKDCHDR